MNERDERARAFDWSAPWIDAVAFTGGLAAAWFSGWNTTDLVWSLWLASLVVGYAAIVWILSAALREFAGNVVRDESAGLSWIAGGAILVAAFLVGLAFFSVHFGGFHFVHSVFLQQFFPVMPVAERVGMMPDLALYGEVFRRYWIFLPVAFLAERAVFAPAIAVRLPSPANAGSKPMPRPVLGDNLMAPYRNVIRMHLLIFFFAGAHFAHAENFAVYAVVYAVYFFPWRILRRSG